MGKRGFSGERFSYCIILLLLSSIFHSSNLFGLQGSSIAGTVDIATLSPADSTITAGASQAYSFSAVNNKSFTLQEYSAVFNYDVGLTISDLSTTPAAKIASVSRSKRQIQLKWTNIAPGIEFRAAFTAFPNLGTYHITPHSITYSGSKRKKYSGSCNAATLVVEAEPPRNFRSISGEGFINIIWDAYTADPIVGYMIYRKTPTTQYVRITGTPVNYTYKDSNVQNNETYYYAIAAADASGNESAFLAETAETYFDLKKTIINESGASVAATGDINGDGKPDIVMGLPDAMTGTGTISGAVEIYFGGNTTGIADITLWGEIGGDKFGFALAVADLNNDGYDDLVIGAPGYSPVTYWPLSGTAPHGGRIYIYAGGQTIGSTPVRTINGDWSYGCNGGCFYTLEAEHFGYSVAAAGDINGDGFDDVTIGAPFGGMDRSGSVFIVYGSSTFGSGRIEIRGPDAGQHMGAALVSAGDVNGDGNKDILTCGCHPNTDLSYRSCYTGPSEGKLYLYYGGTWAPALSVMNFCRSLAMPDINGDGYSDLAVFTDTGIDIHYGGPQLSAQPSFTVFRDYYHQRYLESLGDINNDGYDDLIEGGPVVYFGNANDETVADIEREVGLDLIGVGDVDGDGRKEAFVNEWSSAVYVYTLAPYLSLPSVEIKSPKSGSVQPADTVTIQGQLKGTESTLKVGGYPAALLPDGTFSSIVRLADGDNFIEIIAETPDNKISKRMLYLSHISVPPLTVAITSPANGASINASPVTVTGTMSDATARVAVNGIQAVISNNSFSASDVALQEGSNTITAYAVDKYNQTATGTINVTLSTKGFIAGTVTDAVTGSLLPDVAVVATDSSGSHTAITDSAGVYLIEGVTQGAFTAVFSKSGYVTFTHGGTLIAGQTATLNARLTPVSPLTITITSPQDGVTLSASPITVAGSVSNNAQVTVNGTNAFVNNGTFSASIPLTEGINTITATATDQYVQTKTHSITITLTTKGTVTGTVIDSATGLPVPSANISITDSMNISQTALTGSDGIYSIAGMASGAFTGTITKEGYTMYSFSGTVPPGQTTTINGALNPILPIISSIAVNNITADTAIISWTTDQPSDSLVEYGETTAYGNALSDSTMTANHSLALTGLKSNTTYHFKVTSKNSYGLSSSSGDNTFTTSGIIAITITLPSDDSTVTGPDVTVQGTVTNVLGNETGITVNGVVTTTYGNQFIANHVPLTEGSNTIKATATDSAGNAASASITVNAVTTGNYIRITSNIESGTAPLETTLRIDGLFTIENSSIIVDNGTGVERLSAGTDEYTVRLNAEGVYQFTANVTGPDGNVYQDTIAITVMNKEQLDNLLKARWASMTNALKIGDTSTALSYIAMASRTSYQEMFDDLASQLPTIVSTQVGFSLISIEDRVAKYELVTSENGKTYGYEVIFVTDANGLWTVQDF
jgi:hypothetical protein